MNALINYAQLRKHLGDYDNPHLVTSEQVNSVPANTINEDTPIEEIPVGITINSSENFPSLPYRYFTVITVRPTESRLAHQMVFNRNAPEFASFIRYHNSSTGWTGFQEFNYVEETPEEPPEEGESNE